MGTIPRLILAMPIAWLVGKCGLRNSLYICAGFITIRSIANSFLYAQHWHLWSQLRLVYWLVAIISSTVSSTIYNTLPLKMSESWFAENERTFVWSFCSIAESFGCSLAGMVLPVYIKTASDAYKLIYANGFVAIVCILATVFGVKRSKPLHPATERTIKSSSVAKQPALETLKLILASRNIMLIMFVGPIFESIYIAIHMLLADILRKSKITPVAVGQLVASLLFTGGVAQASLALLIGDKGDFVNRNPVNYKIIIMLAAVGLGIYAGALVLSTSWQVLIVAAVVSQLARQLTNVNIRNMSAYLISGYLPETGFVAAQTVLGCIIFNIDNGLLLLLRRFDQPNSSLSQFYNMSISSLLEEEEASNTSFNSTSIINLRDEAAEVSPVADYSVSIATVASMPVLFALIFACLFTAKKPQITANRLRSSEQASRHEGVAPRRES